MTKQILPLSKVMIKPLVLSLQTLLFSSFKSMVLIQLCCSNYIHLALSNKVDLAIKATFKTQLQLAILVQHD